LSPPPSRLTHDNAARASVVVHTRAIPGIVMRSRYAAGYLARKSHIILRKSSASCGSISTDAIRLQIWLILGIASQLFRRPRGGPLAKISPDGRKFLLGGAKYLSGQACRVRADRGGSSKMLLRSAQCPLWVISGHSGLRFECPLCAKSRHWVIQLGFRFSASFSALRTISTPIC
jgi:hypothetical protein